MLQHIGAVARATKGDDAENELDDPQSSDVRVNSNSFAYVRADRMVTSNGRGTQEHSELQSRDPKLHHGVNPIRTSLRRPLTDTQRGANESVVTGAVVAEHAGRRQSSDVRQRTDPESTLVTSDHSHGVRAVVARAKQSALLPQTTVKGDVASTRTSSVAVVPRATLPSTVPLSSDERTVSRHSFAPQGAEVSHMKHRAKYVASDDDRSIAPHTRPNRNDAHVEPLRARSNWKNAADAFATSAPPKTYNEGSKAALVSTPVLGHSDAMMRARAVGNAAPETQRGSLVAQPRPSLRNAPVEPVTGPMHSTVCRAVPSATRTRDAGSDSQQQQSFLRNAALDVPHTRTQQNVTPSNAHGSVSARVGGPTAPVHARSSTSGEVHLGTTDAAASMVPQPTGLPKRAMDQSYDVLWKPLSSFVTTIAKRMTAEVASALTRAEPARDWNTDLGPRPEALRTGPQKRHVVRDDDRSGTRTLATVPMRAQPNTSKVVAMSGVEHRGRRT
jgi:hypothetical protein